MISAQTTTFKFVDRGWPSAIVLIPGWASDYRIFERLDLKYNYLIPVDFSLCTFEEKLLLALKEHCLEKISLFGWSLGGFLAYEFSSKYSSCVYELILVSIRQKYKKEELDQIKKYLRESKKGYLHRFYSQCFYNSEHRNYFKRNFAKKYYEEMELNCLINGLDYLSKAEIEIKSLKKIEKIKIVHGEFDKIVPLEEAKELKDKLPQAKFIVVEGTGHMPFLKEDFLDI